MGNLAEILYDTICIFFCEATGNAFFMVELPIIDIKLTIFFSPKSSKTHHIFVLIEELLYIDGEVPPTHCFSD